MIRKTRRRGGMRAALKPLGQAVTTLGKEYGKDWIKTKSIKVTEGLHKDPNLIKDPNFMLYGKKPISKPKFDMYDDMENMENIENINPNLKRGGKTKKRNNKKRKTMRNKK